jgi:CO dehydrogenase/acetyl-CoA synthase delta subunit
MPFFVVDRIAGDIAVVAADDGRSFDVPRARLPKPCREGTVLRLEESVADQPPDWSRAVVDDAERARRVERDGQILQELENSDPGGDIDL